MILNNKQVLIVSMLLLMLCFLTAVSAVDNATGETTTQTVNTNTDSVSTADTADTNTNDAEESVGTFTELDEEIQDTGDVLVLNRDYIYNNDGDYAYRYGIRIHKPIVIDGNGHTINGLNQARIFEVESKNVVIKNINLIHGYSKDFGGAIRWTKHNGTLENSNLSDNLAKYGGAVIITASKIVVNNNTFSNNYAFEFAGALYITDYDTTVTNNYFITNEAGNKYPAIFNARPLISSNNTFINNSKFLYGGNGANSPKQSFIQSHYRLKTLL